MVLAMTHEEVVDRSGPAGDQLLPPAAAARLPHPDQVAGRAARPRRADPRPRVHDEGLLQPRSSTRPGWTSSTSNHWRRLRAHLPPLRARLHRGRRRHRDDGRHGLARVHGPLAERRGHVLICPNGDYAANREVATFRRDAPRGEALLPLEEVETPNTTDHPGARPTSSASRCAQTAKAVFYQGRLRPLRLRRHPRRSRGQRDQAAQGRRRERPHPGDGRGDPGASAPSRATARRSACATR